MTNTTNTFDVVFNSEDASNSKGFKKSQVSCALYISANNGSNTGYFGDYKGGTVSIVCNETSETVYSEEVR
jgi:hypothetical protein